MSKEKYVFVGPEEDPEEYGTDGLGQEKKLKFSYKVVCLGGSGWTIGLDSLILFTSGEREGEYYHAHVGGGAQLLKGPLTEEEVEAFKVKHEEYRKQRGYWSSKGGRERHALS